MWEGVTVDTKCEFHQRDWKGIREVCQLSGSVTVLKRFVSWWGGVMAMGRSKRD